ncbi:MAG: TIGR04219 family outer membrane beta-barrel protein [Cellvibrionaceae bacterium]
MKKALYTTLIALLLSTPVYSAPLIDFTVTASQWQTEYSGRVGQGADTASLDDLGFEDENFNVVRAVLRHPIPVIPNLLVQRTDLDTEANGTLTGTFVFDGVTYIATEQVSTTLDLSHTDATLFYSPLSNWVTFDIGLTGRHFNGEASVTGSTAGSSSIDLDDWIPLVYFNARFELPLTGLYIGGTINTISHDDNTLKDFSAALGYVVDGAVVDLVAELGYRAFTLDVDDINDFEGNIDIDGLYFTLGLKF